MNNPWVNLKKNGGEYAAPCDRQIIRKYSHLRLDGIPAPYTGDPENAALYMLALNPGHGEGEDEVYRKNNKYLIANLTHKNKEWPFVPFNPVFRDTPAGSWWARNLKELLDAAGIETLARFVVSAEYFPYHSKTYTHIPEILPSQEYTFSLVGKAVKDKKIIVMMRSKKLWFKAVPELKDYKKLIILKNPRSPALSVKNMRQDNFNAIAAALRKAAKKAPSGRL